MTRWIDGSVRRPSNSTCGNRPAPLRLREFSGLCGSRLCVVNGDPDRADELVADPFHLPAIDGIDVAVNFNDAILDEGGESDQPRLARLSSHARRDSERVADDRALWC